MKRIILSLSIMVLFSTVMSACEPIENLPPNQEGNTSISSTASDFSVSVTMPNTLSKADRVTQIRHAYEDFRFAIYLSSNESIDRTARVILTGVCQQQECRESLHSVCQFDVATSSVTCQALGESSSTSSVDAGSYFLITEACRLREVFGSKMCMQASTTITLF